MTIDAQLPPEVESELSRQAEMARQGISTSLAESGHTSVSLEEGDSQAPFDEWQREFRAWIESHRSRNPDVDDSRESIYD